MSTENHPDDQSAIEKLHVEFINRFDRVNDDLMTFQDAAYAMGRARGLLEAATASVILPPAPEMPEEPLFADDDSYMDAYHAACRMRTACAEAIAAAGIGLKLEP